MLVSINPGGPNGGSATQYFIGDFDGQKFTTETIDTKWIDWGTDNYAGVTYSNIPASDGRRIMIGWMSNWIYAGQVPTTAWRSTMTIPRVITLIQQGQNFNLNFNPVEDLRAYKNNTADTTIQQTVNTVGLINNKIIKTGSYELNFTADFTKTDSLLLSIGNDAENLKINFDKPSKRVSIDRSRSGYIDFNNQFSEKIICPSLALGSDQKVNIRMFIDKTSVELFWNNGEKTMTALFFPRYQYNYLKIQGNRNMPLISNFTLKEIRRSLLR